MAALLYSFLFIVFFLQTSFVFGNPCAAENIQRGKYRGTECEWRDGKVTHDRDIVQDEHWYKAIDENGVPLSMPTTGLKTNLRCSTNYPIWMNGSNPTIEDGEVSYKACVHGGGLLECDHAYDITVKNCTNFLAYKLKRPDNTGEAYCFGDGRWCPPTDPCEDIDRETLEDDGYRSSTCTPVNLCDNDINGWYLVQNSGQNLQMATNAPSPGSCGAEYPLWMADKHPEQSEGNVSRKVCVTNATSDCTEYFYLNAINCGQFFVYELQKRSDCPQRYCFGTINFNVVCPENSTIADDLSNKGSLEVNVNVASFGVTVLTSILWMFSYHEIHLQ